MAGVTSLRMILAVLLGVDATNSALWAARIASAAAAHDAVVLGMVALRVAVTALQAVAAWLLVRRAPPAFVLARAAFAGSAVLLVLELGARLAPSSIAPGLRYRYLAAYVLYSLACIRAIGWLERREQSA